MDAVLSGQFAVIVGGTSGIGLEIGRQMAQAGCAGVVLVGRGAEAGERAAAELKSRWPEAAASYLPADTTDPASIARLVAEVSRRIERVDILVHGISSEVTPLPFEQLEETMIVDQLTSHLTGALYAARGFVPGMIAQGGGSLLFLGSDAAKVPTPGETVIGAAKAGLAMFVRTLSLEVSRHAIRANCITPSIVRGTRTYDRLMANEFSAALFRKAERRAKLGVAVPGDVAPLAVFLSSPLASKITGQIISVNSGISAA